MRMDEMSSLNKKAEELGIDLQKLPMPEFEKYQIRKFSDRTHSERTNSDSGSVQDGQISPIASYLPRYAPPPLTLTYVYRRADLMSINTRVI